MFRFFISLIAILGYMLGITLVSFAIFPLQKTVQKTLDLKDLHSCIPHILEYSSNDLDSIQDLNSQLELNLPLDQIQNLAKNIDTIANYVGMYTKINIEYCDIYTTDQSNDLFTELRNYLKTNSYYYEYGSINDFINSLNQNFPLLKLGMFDLKFNSLFIRTTTCNTPITQSRLYLAIAPDVPENTPKRITLITLKLVNNNDSSTIQQGIRNLIETGHYFKEMFTCHGQ
ncbi:MAG: hypothetical protein KatS3mg084_0057 [Candidatus Dojkabacteria bacterium]|nr:MAG: hypothetical protein KatS3mg084_0057 [Candidatus Dojkabacteria bacterium]